MVCPLAGKNWATDRKKAKKRQLTEGMTEKTLTYLTVLLWRRIIAKKREEEKKKKRKKKKKRREKGEGKIKERKNISINSSHE